jgi:phosphomannomutase
LVTEVKKFRGRLDFGVAFDGDGDRAKFIDETGEIISEDEITALISIYLIQEYRQKHLEGKPKTTKPKIIIELKSSKLVEEAVTKVEGEIVREKTGRIYIKEHMARDNDIIFGGELSGHYFYRKYFCGREFYPVDTGEDGLFTALLLGRIVQESGKQLSQLRAELPKYETSGEIRYTYRKEKKGEEMESEITKILKQLRDFYSEDAGDSQRKSFMLKVIERDEDTRVEIGGQDGKQDHYCSVIFRNSKNDPQKLTLVFEGKTKESLDYIRQDFLGRIAKIESLDSKYSGLRESLEKKVFPGG